MTTNRNGPDAAALDMLNGGTVLHTAVWDPAAPVVTRPLLLDTPEGWYTYSFGQMKE